MRLIYYCVNCERDVCLHCRLSDLTRKLVAFSILLVTTQQSRLLTYVRICMVMVAIVVKHFGNVMSFFFLAVFFKMKASCHDSVDTLFHRFLLSVSCGSVCKKDNIICYECITIIIMVIIIYCSTLLHKACINAFYTLTTQTTFSFDDDFICRIFSVSCPINATTNETCSWSTILSYHITTSTSSGHFPFPQGKLFGNAFYLSYIKTYKVQLGPVQAWRSSCPKQYIMTMIRENPIFTYLLLSSSKP